MSVTDEDTLVEVHPYMHKADGREVIIGDPGRQVFLAIPAEGLEILESLQAGHTVGETVRAYVQRHGETPDIDDFLEILAQEGFVSTGHSTAIEAVGDPESSHSHGDDPRVHEFKRWSLDWISERTARRIASVPVLILFLAVIVAGLGALFADPGVYPPAGVMLFPDGNMSLMILATVGIAVVGVALHELAHAIVARSAGASATVGIGNLMYILVVQTHMSEVWFASRWRRYAAFLVGLLVDTALLGVFSAFLYATKHGLIQAPHTLYLLAQTAFLTFTLRINFQFFVYLRTDVYYVLATALRTKNLMGDAETLLRNVWNRITLRRNRVEDQSAIPRGEMTKVRFFAVFYVLGRILAITVLVFFILPVLWGYLQQFIYLVTGQPTRFHVIDLVTVAAVSFLLNGTGIYMWIRNMFRSSARRRQARAAALS